MRDFHDDIVKALDEFSYPIWIIKRIPSIPCTCINPTTKQPDPSCKKCLSLGTKIKAYKTKGVAIESNDPNNINNTRFPTTTAKAFYVKDKNKLIKTNDMIIDKEDAYSIFHKQYKRGKDGKIQYTRCICPEIKLDNRVIIKNFKELLRRYGHQL